MRPTFPGQTLAAAVRQIQTGLSWAEARRLISSRRVWVNGSLCLDDARRLNASDAVEVIGESETIAPPERGARIVFVDEDLVVVEKPAGVQTVRRIEERDWSEERKRRQPVLLEIVDQMLRPMRRKRDRKRKTSGANPPYVRAVHRLDRDTSGLMLFAISAAAERELVRRFAGHEIRRVYRAVVHGTLAGPRTIETWIVRDRGDGIRGSMVGENRPDNAQRAVTHLRPIEPLGRDYSLVECRLETGRTHQIRIHLAEIGHMLCGEKIYMRPFPDAPVKLDESRAPRQALHSAELQFEHPLNGRAMRFTSEWPKDLARWIAEVRCS